MSQRASLAGLFVGAILVVVAYASAWSPHGGTTWGAWTMVLGSAVALASATALGAANSHVRPWLLRAVTVFLFIVIVLGFGLPFVLPPDAANPPMILGLPLRVAIEVYGVGILPSLVLPVVFALEFRSAGLDEAALAALRERCAELQRQR